MIQFLMFAPSDTSKAKREGFAVPFRRVFLHYYDSSAGRAFLGGRLKAAAPPLFSAHDPAKLH
jgi:hypothetical protein